MIVSIRDDLSSNSPLCDYQYYFRYEGSMPEPPCFEGVHWRVLNNPVRVAPKQIDDLEILISNRLDPLSCKHETVGKPSSPGAKRVHVNRPVQTTTPDHKLVFCECDDWESNQLSDVAWCKRKTLPLGAHASAVRAYIARVWLAASQHVP
jgi:hypothetical protein